MAGDQPFSMNYKWINARGIEALFSIRGANGPAFAANILEANNLFPTLDTWGGDEMRECPEVAAAKARLLIVSGDSYVGLGTSGMTPEQQEAEVNRLHALAEQQRLQAVKDAPQKAATANAQRRAEEKDNTPTCPTHGRKLLKSKFDNVDWYCAARDPDTNAYCDFRIFPDDKAA